MNLLSKLTLCLLVFTGNSTNIIAGNNTFEHINKTITDAIKGHDNVQATLVVGGVLLTAYCGTKTFQYTFTGIKHVFKTGGAFIHESSAISHESKQVVKNYAIGFVFGTATAVSGMLTYIVYNAQ